MPAIPTPEETPKGSLPDNVAEFSQEDEDLEVVPYKISLSDYKDKECQIDNLKPSNSKAALKMVRDIGVNFTSESNFSAKSSQNIAIKPVFPNGDYKNLYKGLVDQEVKEAICINPKKEVDFRLFFYSLENERTFYLLAVREDHYNLDHSNEK